MTHSIRTNRRDALAAVNSNLVSGDSVTMSQGSGTAKDAEAEVIPYLVVLLECQRPDAPSSRHLLRDTRLVRIGRGKGEGSSRQVARETQDQSLSIAVPDKWMSSQHARLTNQFGRWFLEDANSKNGTLHGGQRVSQVRLSDGDVFFTGRTLFLFRCNALVPVSATSDFEHDEPTSEVGSELLTLSPTFATELANLSQMATAPLSILIRGETGTGKEMVARAIHRLSGRQGPFVRLNCGAYGTEAIERELEAVFSQSPAGPGTLFLDEIADLNPDAQTVLLRLLREREAETGDGLSENHRIIASTSEDLHKRITVGGLRRDLFARLCGYEFTLPALRQRREDIGLLFRTLLTKHQPPVSDSATNSGLSSGGGGITQEAARLVVDYNWPLNIRELDNAIAASAALAGGGAIEASHLPPTVRAGPRIEEDEPAAQQLSEADRRLRDTLCGVLQENNGNISATARQLGKDRKQIQRWLKRLNINASGFREAE